MVGDEIGIGIANVQYVHSDEEHRNGSLTTHRPEAPLAFALSRSSSGDEELTTNYSLTKMLGLPDEQRQRAKASGEHTPSFLLFLEALLETRN